MSYKVIQWTTSAIPAVCDAGPGIKTYADLPLIAGRYVHLPK